MNSRNVTVEKHDKNCEGTVLYEDKSLDECITLLGINHKYRGVFSFGETYRMCKVCDDSHQNPLTGIYD